MTASDSSASAPHAPGPLTGVRVVDLSTVVLGPYATQILGDLGADIIKVEAPEGDVTRALGPARHPGMAAMHLTINRNKRSLQLDLKRPAALAALLKVTASADVFLHNMRPAAARALGVDYAAIRAVNPAIVYCFASGFGPGGPYANMPAYDDVIQGACGIAGLEGMVGDRPRYSPTVMADKTVGMSVVYAVLAALFHRQKSGEGQEIEVPMFETMASWTALEHTWGRTFDPPLGTAGYPRLLTPMRRPHQTADGWLSTSPYTDTHWKKFFALTGQPEMFNDPRFCDVQQRTANIGELYALLGAELRKRPTAWWVEQFSALEIPVAPVHDMNTLYDDPHLRAVGAFEEAEHPSEGRIVNMRPPIRFSATPASIRRQAPQLGEHGVEILREAGLSDAEIAAAQAARGG